ncbi:uncharacterized protein LOC133014031 isoform X2 [Limanda limanda]|uniref:uncharacterized protein LOC133014031 isoform X2 n=1 Tax=Limanda limanda TaxID=27771 RepID=UPI0029C81F4A|nr:uncharacterized protein LOC133014031 isoform X2 [Limanda limanda]
MIFNLIQAEDLKEPTLVCLGLFTPSLISSSSLPHLFLYTSVSCSAANMRNLISVAVILHVAFTVAGLQLKGKEVEFGDMIAYKPQCAKSLDITYQHYAIFVGDEYPGQGNTFERTDPKVFNYLDGYVDEKGKAFTKGNEAEMKARIEETHDHCGEYDAICNNCEHLATYVRYGKKISIQFNMTGGKMLCKIRPKAEDMWKFVKKLYPASSVNPVGSTSLYLIALFLADMSF